MSGSPMHCTELQASAMQPATPMTVRVRWLRRPLYFGLSLVTMVTGIWMMFHILSPNGLTWLELPQLLLFSLSFAWVSLSFCSGLIGFVLQLLRLDPYTLRRSPATVVSRSPVSTRTAVVMPVYNEDTARIMAGFEANLRALAATGQIAHFDFYMLSDTRDTALAEAELQHWHAMMARLGEPLASHAFYRRREFNTGRKVGNIADFCQRWGSQYPWMIVLDADSLMTGECMLSLVHAMEQNPRAGLIQTVPIPVRQSTFFGRFLQFAATLHSPMLATGLAFWQYDTANYWGHNAILHTSAFMAHCGLPKLEGRAPFGGDILSHDFVEAALLRRAGWEVLLLPDLEGSYEELPSNFIDYATRDRRWAEGNIQHLGLLNITGLHPLNQLHFVLGATAYIASLLWLLMLAFSSTDAVMRALHSNIFFETQYQLFPTWQIARTEMILSLLYFTAILLFLPKLLAVFVGLLQRREVFGGAARLAISALLECFTAILIAPVMMAFHAYFVVCILIGRKTKWEAQPREGRMVPWREAFHRTLFASLMALLWGVFTYQIAPLFFWWISPVLIGLVLAAPIVRFSSSIALGEQLRQKGIFLTPGETAEPPLLTMLKAQLAQPLPPGSPATTPSLPPEYWRDMPTQALYRHHLRRRKGDTSLAISSH